MQTRVPFEKLKDAFVAALLKAGLSKDRAELCGRLFAENQRDGVYSHGLNRFPGLLAKLSEGRLDGTAEPECVKSARRRRTMGWQNGNRANQCPSRNGTRNRNRKNKTAWDA